MTGRSLLLALAAVSGCGDSAPAPGRTFFSSRVIARDAGCLRAEAPLTIAAIWSPGMWFNSLDQNSVDWIIGVDLTSRLLFNFRSPSELN
jgi:hypothetical protein